MKKGLFVLFEGIPNTIFKSQVLEHVKDMNSNGIDMDILAINTESKMWRTSLLNYNELVNSNLSFKITLLKSCRIYYPFSELYNLLLLWKYLKSVDGKYSYIHARANYSSFISTLLKIFIRIDVLWDCRGESLSELHDAISRKNRLYKVVLMPLLLLEKFRLLVISKYADAAVFVSNALYSKYAKWINTNNIEIIPCPVAESKFYFNKDKRYKLRSYYNISDEINVFMYSGSMVAYQAVEQQIILYRKILERDNHIIFYLTSDIALAKETFQEFSQDRFVIKSVPFVEMNDYYNLADFSFLIRDALVLNFVASPTKFGEYCLTGLPVIMNDAVEQAYKNAILLGNCINISPLDLTNVKRFDDNRREKIANGAKKIYSRSVLNEKYKLIYSQIGNV